MYISQMLACMHIGATFGSLGWASCGYGLRMQTSMACNYDLFHQTKSYMSFGFSEPGMKCSRLFCF